MGLALLLMQMHYTVQVANSAQEALEKGGPLQPDVIFLDIGLPDLNGYEVCMEMREREWGGKAFIVALTGRNEPSDVLRAANTGFDRHVGKPMDLKTLREILSTVEARTDQERSSEVR